MGPRISLLTADPSLAGALRGADLALATRLLQAPRLDLPAGDWTPPPRDSWPGPTLGLVLLEGVVARRVALADRVATHLLGPGDLVRPWTSAGSLPSAARWSVLEPGAAAVLDRLFATAAVRWPELAAPVQERLGEAADRLAEHLAICQLPRGDQRVLALLWHLAERFGRVTPDGVALSLRLTHRLLGELAGAQRPTVSLALATLLADGQIARRPDGSLLLAADSYASLAPDTRPSRAVAERAPVVWVDPPREAA